MSDYKEICTKLVNSHTKAYIFLFLTFIIMGASHITQNPYFQFTSYLFLCICLYYAMIYVACLEAKEKIDNLRKRCQEARIILVRANKPFVFKCL